MIPKTWTLGHHVAGCVSDVHINRTGAAIICTCSIGATYQNLSLTFFITWYNRNCDKYWYCSVIFFPVLPTPALTPFSGSNGHKTEQTLCFPGRCHNLWSRLKPEFWVILPPVSGKLDRALERKWWKKWPPHWSQKTNYLNNKKCAAM